MTFLTQVEEDLQTLSTEASIQQLHINLTSLKAKITQLFEIVESSESSNSLRLQGTSSFETSESIYCKYVERNWIIQALNPKIRLKFLGKSYHLL